MRRVRPRVRWAFALLAATGGAVAWLSPGSAAPAASTAAPPAPTVVAAASGAVAAVAAPVRLTVPAIGVDTALPGIGVDDAGALVPPADPALAGWFTAGPAPGATGPAVVAGHVDDRTGPAVFFRLEELVPGDLVTVARADGTTVRFTVTRVTSYPKRAFGTAEVYGPTTGPELRLITCGGEFDRDRRSYEDNVVVFARVAG
ncbi:class F sortase [Modestobacter sp. I12A-02662]|uniref:class F sortase n=1 Tax=Modestobacter sp. I12A-02662 TaxID=1730496 RepID=UPI0034DE10A1